MTLPELAHRGDLVQFLLHRRIAQPIPLSAYDAVLLSCKAYDLDDAMDAIAPAVTGDCVVVPVLNGVRHIDDLSESFGKNHVFGGLTAVDAALMPGGEIVQSAVRVDMTGFGELDGKVSARCLALQAAFAAGGIKADASTTIMASMWTKFVTFGSIATIASLIRARAGAIARTASSRALVDARARRDVSRRHGRRIQAAGRHQRHGARA